MRLRRCPGGVTVSTLSRHVRGLGFDSRDRTPFSIYLCSIYLVFTVVLRLLSACTLERGAPFTASCLDDSFLTLIGRAPPALHLRSYIIVFTCVFIVG